MADVEVKDWNQTNDSNGTVNGINIATGCPPASLNQAIRAVMGALARFVNGTATIPKVTTTGDVTVGGNLAVTGTTTHSGVVAMSGNKITGLPNGTTSGDAVHFGQFAQNIGTGYITLPGGMLLQWGTATTNGSGTITVTFPTAFPSAVRSITANPSFAGVNTICMSVGAVSTTTAAFYSNAGFSNSAAPTVVFYWMAVGN